MYKHYNPNPAGRLVDDCSVRALAKALDVDWETAFLMTAVNAYMMCDIQSANTVWGSVLRLHGFTREVIPTNCSDCYSAEDFCIDNPKGVYVLGFGTHVATVVDGDLYDAWDSSKLSPQYFWYKQEEKKK